MFSITPKTRFWVVTYPTKVSELRDICFETDLAGLRLQFMSGLSADDICTIEENKSMAVQSAASLLGMEYKDARKIMDAPK